MHLAKMGAQPTQAFKPYRPIHTSADHSRSRLDPGLSPFAGIWVSAPFHYIGVMLHNYDATVLFRATRSTLVLPFPPALYYFSSYRNLKTLRDF